MSEMGSLLRNECVVTGALGLVLRVSRIAGVAPLRFKKTRGGWIVRVSPAAHTYGRIFATALMLLGILTITMDAWTRLSCQKTTFAIMWPVALFCPVMVVSVAAFTGLQRMRCLIDCMTLLQKINLKLCVQHEKRSSETIRMIILVASMAAKILSICVHYTMNASHVRITFGGIGMDILFVLSTLITEIIANQFCQLAMSVLISLQMLNKRLKNLLKEIIDSRTPEAYQSIAPRVRQLCFLYGTIGDVVRDVNHSFGSLLISVLFNLLLILIFIPYSIIMYIVHESGMNMYVLISWGVVYLSNTLMIIEPCHRTHEQMNLTKQLISQMIRFSPPEHRALMSGLELFHRQLMLNNVTYSPLAMFTLNRALIVTILGSITTYLFILIQY